MARTFILLLTAAGLLAFGYIAGKVQPVFAEDSTGIVWGVAALAVLGTLAAESGWRQRVLEFLCAEGVTMALGLLGTVIGFISALVGVVGGDEAMKIAGVEAALYTTAAGMVAHLWLLLVREVTK